VAHITRGVKIENNSGRFEIDEKVSTDDYSSKSGSDFRLKIFSPLGGIYVPVKSNFRDKVENGK
jgi:hypothetical protein